MPKVAVIVPSYNGRKLLEGCLKSLSRQTFSDFETVVVDDGSTDDTIGFVKNLPHQLIASFKATLEEAILADLVIEVLDMVSPQVEEHHRTTRAVLDELGIADKPSLLVFNKLDLVDNTYLLPRLRRRQLGLRLLHSGRRLANGELQVSLRPRQVALPRLQHRPRPFDLGLQVFLVQQRDELSPGHLVSRAHQHSLHSGVCLGGHIHHQPGDPRVAGTDMGEGKPDRVFPPDHAHQRRQPGGA